MQKIKLKLLFLVCSLNLCLAQDKWVWPETKTNRKSHDLNPSAAEKAAYYIEDQYDRADRNREPTTKRPLPGQVQNDEIDDDYIEANDESTKQNSPYPGFNSLFKSFGNHPQIGAFPSNAANGILIGPGGPTGFTGRPHIQYPGLGPVSAPTPFPVGQAGYPSYAVAQNFPGALYNNPPGFLGNNGLGLYSGPPAAYAYPNPQRFPGIQFPQAQYPGVQYPNKPLYTEGYGLANLRKRFNANSAYTSNVNPATNFNLTPNYGFGYDELAAHPEAINENVDDKVAKVIKRL